VLGTCSGCRRFERRPAGTPRRPGLIPDARRAIIRRQPRREQPWHT
jgi:hypothetical protein